MGDCWGTAQRHSSLPSISWQPSGDYESHMKTKGSLYHLGTAPTSRARCKRCRSVVPKGAVRLVVTAFVTRGHTTRFSRCLRCLDAPLATAVSTACDGTQRLMAAPEVDPAVAEAMRTEFARLALVGKVGKVARLVRKR